MSEAIFSPVDRPVSEIQVVAFPYAGAGIAAFSGWAERFPENFDFSIVCYPGREKRFNEKALDNMADLIEDLSFSFQDNLGWTLGRSCSKIMPKSAWKENVS